MNEPRELSLHLAAQRMRRGQLSAEALVLSCLERIEARQPQVRAWVVVHGEQALEQARHQDREAARGHWQGPLHGIPLGIKDIIDVAGMDTRAGCEAYPGGLASRDAACVARLREAGAIFLGKLTTTAFAFSDPVPDTRNPWNLAHTPGGSSAGSGAAVADRMCMGALGTQTGGSVLRPAAFNGLAGFKPSLGAISTEGVIPLSWSLDHVGALARTVEDANLLWQVLRVGHRVGWRATPEKMTPALVPRAPRRVWRIRDFFESEAHPECLENLEYACRILAAHGAEIVEGPLPDSFAEVVETHRCIMAADAAASHQSLFAAQRHLYPPLLQALLEQGQQRSAVEYVAAHRRRAEMRAEIAERLAGVDVAIMPSTVTPPPDPATTGDPRFNAPWSLCGLPALTLPTALNPDGLPLGVQLVAGEGREDALLAAGGWCESLFAFGEKPA